MTESLVDRIKAVLDEDERVANGVEFEDWYFDLIEDGKRQYEERFDRKRVLRQVAAMRKILDEHDKLFASASERRKAGQPDMALNGAVLALHGVVKRLAEAYGIDTPEQLT